MKRITGRFTNSAGQLCYVNVYDTNYVGDPTELYMSTNPITISESAQDMLTEPIMASSAVLTFISDPALDGLVVSDEMQCRVEVTADSQLIWSGYLNPEVRDDLLPSITSEVTLNATSALGLMKTRKINPEGKAMCSIAEYIYEALNDCGCMLENICIPAVAKTDSSSGYNSLWTLTIQRDNFYTREDVTDTDEEQYDAQSWYDVLSNFMKLFGLTMREDYESGCVMLQSRSIDATYNTMTTYIFSIGEGAENYTSPDRANMTDLSLWGTNHSISTYAPVKKVKVVSNINSMEGLICSNERMISGPKLRELSYILVDTDNQVQKRYVFSGKIVSILNNNVKPTAYVSNGTELQAITNLTGGDIDTRISETGFIVGSQKIKALEMAGAIPVRGLWALSTKMADYSKGAQKIKSWRLKNCTSAWSFPVVNLPDGTELLRYEDSAFRIKGPFAIGLYSEFSKPISEKKISPVKFSLRVGNLYWNGNSWQENETTFIPEYEYEHNGRWHIKTTSDEDIQADYSNSNGLLIVSEDNQLYADGIQLKVLVNSSWVGDRGNGEVYMSELSLSLSSNQDNITYNDFTDEVVKSFNTIAYRDNGGGTDIDPVEINVHSDNGYQQARSYLWNGSATINTLLYLGGTFTPERHLANLLKAIYCRTRKRYKLVTEGINYKGNTLYSYQGHDYCVVCKSVDPYRNTTTLVLEQAT